MMPVRRRAAWCLALLLAAAAGAHPAAQQPTLADVLERAGKYVLKLESDLSGVVAEEHYTQNLMRAGSLSSRGGGPAVQTNQQHRDLRSDVLVIRPEGADRYIQFRDVFEVDGKPVRDRDDRLAMLFLHPAPSTSEQLQEIREDSARYNLGDISRDFNVPVLALMFLHPENQPRFMFTLTRSGRPGQPWEIEYLEVRPNTLIRTTADRDLPVRGRFRIEPDTGRVLLSELVAETEVVSADVTVTYERDATLGFFAPTEMRESVGTRDGILEIKGRATYSRFRRFQVKVEESINK
jgi:hypothetical protein